MFSHERQERQGARVAAALLGWLLLTVSTAAAQQLTATAELPVAAPTGMGTRDLAFGAITLQPGQTTMLSVPAAVAPMSGSAHSGAYRFNVGNTRGVTFSVAPPTELTAPDAAPLALSYNSDLYGAFCVSAGTACTTLTNFNPATTPQQTVCMQMLGNGSCHQNRFFATGTELAVYIGGLVAVPAAQRAGVYTGVVTLTILQVH
jgi:hypothetical protein